VVLILPEPQLCEDGIVGIDDAIAIASVFPEIEHGQR